jgi:hypothetical protein
MITLVVRVIQFQDGLEVDRTEWQAKDDLGHLAGAINHACHVKNMEQLQPFTGELLRGISE